MAKLKSQLHHWWPECVSKHWADQNGGVHWMRPSGETKRAAPANFGAIGNGHHIKLSGDPSKPSPWDESFEAEFNQADGQFPKLITWLESLEPKDASILGALGSRLLPQQVSDVQFAKIIECVVSLAVRSPMYRALAVRGAEHFRGPIIERERNNLIGLNVRHSLRTALRQFGGHGKAVVVFSPQKEFLFGDGFFSNLTPPLEHFHGPKILVPLTPRMSVLYVRPMRYTVEPRLTALVVSPSEADALNYAVQVYAKDAIFYRTEPPEIKHEFTQAKHLIFSDARNPVDDLISLVPGVPSRDGPLFGRH